MRAIHLLAFILLTGFIQVDKKKDTSRSISSFVRPVELPVILSYFDEKLIPGQLGGDCSERYAFDALALRIHKMILFTSFDTVIMKINYQLMVFKVAHTELHGKQRITTFSGQGYAIKFTSKEIKKIDDEYFTQSGTIEISRNGQKKIFQVTGIYSC